MVTLVSVVIPVRDGAALLGRCLEAVYSSSYSAFEVIVVDDASRDSPADVAARFPCQVLRLERPRGPARARNLGAAHAGGEILFFTDADVAVLPDTIERAAHTLATRPNLDAVIGSYTAETPVRNFVSRYKNYLHHYTHQRSAGEVTSFFTACGAIRKSVFDALGGFDETITTTALEDVELGYRLARRGHRILLDGAMQMTHLKRYTLGGLLRSDLLGRAIPYTKHMLKHRIFKGELSTGRHNVLSVFLIFSLPLVLGWGFLDGGHLARGLSLLIASLLVGLNRDFYRFLWREAGLRFALGGVAMQWWGYLYSGIGLGMGLVRYLYENTPLATDKVQDNLSLGTPQ